MTDEKIFRRVLVCALCPLYLFIAFIVFLIIGVDKIYAQETINGTTMLCNQYGVDYFDGYYGNQTYCNGYFDETAWDGVLGLNTISSRFTYDFKSNIRYSITITQTINWTTFGSPMGTVYKADQARLVLANNNPNLNFEVTIFTVVPPRSTPPVKKNQIMRYKVTFTPYVNTSYIDLDAYFRGLYFTGYNYKYFKVNSTMTIDSETNIDDSTGVDDIMNNQNQNTQDIINNQNQNTQDIINSNNQNTQIIVDSILDGELDDNTPVDDSGLNSYQDAEDKLVDKDNLNNINNINISVDSKSNNFIWDLITRILNTHTLVFGLMITMLSIGIIKLILNR